jgi:hypothetical protein
MQITAFQISTYVEEAHYSGLTRKEFEGMLDSGELRKLFKRFRHADVQWPVQIPVNYTLSLAEMCQLADVHCDDAVRIIVRENSTITIEEVEIDTEECDNPEDAYSKAVAQLEAKGFRFCEVAEFLALLAQHPWLCRNNALYCIYTSEEGWPHLYNVEPDDDNCYWFGTFDNVGKRIQGKFLVVRK